MSNPGALQPAMTPAELVALYQKAKSDVCSEFLAQGEPNPAQSIVEQLAQQYVQMQCQSKCQVNSQHVALRDFTKFSGDESAVTYAARFESEAIAMSVDTSRLPSIFPSMMQGAKATAVVPKLQACTDWPSMKSEFLSHFQVDPAAVLLDLQVLRCTNYDVEKYTIEFNKLMSKNNWSSADDGALKDAYLRSLPFKLRESMSIHRDPSKYTVSKLQSEAIRVNKAIGLMSGSGGFSGGGKQDKERDKDKGDSGKPQPAARAANQVLDNTLFHRMHICCPETGTALLQAPASSPLVQQLCTSIVHFVDSFFTKDSLTEYEQFCYHRLVDSVMDHLVRQVDTSTQTRGPRLTKRDLYNEAERVLAKSAGGLSLLERLSRDEQLRKDVLMLLEELGNIPVAAPLAPLPKRGGRKKVTESDAEMKDIPIQGMAQQMTITHAVRPGQSISERWSEDELEKFRIYYGCHPKLIEGFEFFQSSEVQTIFRDCHDYCNHTPLSHNSPFVNVLLHDKYKLRAIVDTGSTNTIMSSGMLQLLPDVHMSPTSAGFRSVGATREQYKGIVPNLRVQLTDKLGTSVNVAIIPNDEVWLLIGNDLIGGSYAKFTRVAMSDPMGFMLLQDAKGRQDAVQFVRNREWQELQVAAATSIIPPEPVDSVSKLFRA